MNESQRDALDTSEGTHTNARADVKGRRATHTRTDTANQAHHTALPRHGRRLCCYCFTKQIELHARYPEKSGLYIYHVSKFQ